jgi:large subunit ribosomal protein L6
MSRVAKAPITVANGVTVTIKGQSVEVKGSKGTMTHELHPSVAVEQNDGVITVKPVDEEKQSWAQAGTARALINNMVTGVNDGFEKKLTLIGVGYRAQAKGKSLDLALGFSHPVVYQLPEGITAETPSQTEIVIKGFNKQVVGQVAAEIRAFRPPEPYKGKGIRYADEYVIRKEAKKK